MAASGGSAQSSLQDTAGIVFLGTSLTAGYGLENPDSAYPARVGTEVNAAGYSYQVVNAGVSGDTSAGGRTRLVPLIEALEVPLAVLVIELGANDGLRGQSTDALYDNLTWITREAKRRLPGVGVVVAGMEAPPNLGPLYTDAFRAVFTRVAEENDALLIPFLLEGVAAVPELNQEDGIHPNERGHEMIAAHVWAFLGPYLGSRCALDGAC